MLTPEEITLFDRIRSGDQAAFRQLYLQHFSALAKVAVDLGGDTLLAKDAVQQAFINFWNKRQALKVTTGLYVYLRRMVIHEVLATKRKSARRVALWQKGPERSTSHTDPEDEVIGKETQAAINAAIDSLPERCSEIFRLSRYNEMTYAEIAEALDLSVKTVESQMGKALKELRSKLLNE